MENLGSGGPGGISQGGIKNADPFLEQDIFTFRTPSLGATQGNLVQYRQGITGIHDLIGHNAALKPILNLWQNYEITSVTSQVYLHNYQFADSTGTTSWDASQAVGILSLWPWNRRIGGTEGLPTNKPVGFLNKGLRYYRITPSSFDWSSVIVGGGFNGDTASNYQSSPFIPKFHHTGNSHAWRAAFKTTEPLTLTAKPAYLQVANEGGSVEAAFSNTVQTQAIAIHGSNGLDKTQWYFNVLEFEHDFPLLANEQIILDLTVIDKFTIKFTGPQYNQVTQLKLELWLAETKAINIDRGEPQRCIKDYDRFNPKPREEPYQMVVHDPMERGNSTKRRRSYCGDSEEEDEVPSSPKRCGYDQERQASPSPIDPTGKANVIRGDSEGSRVELCYASPEEKGELVRELKGDGKLHKGKGSKLARVRGTQQGLLGNQT